MLLVEVLADGSARGDDSLAQPRYVQGEGVEEGEIELDEEEVDVDVARVVEFEVCSDDEEVVVFVTLKDVLEVLEFVLGEDVTLTVVDAVGLVDEITEVMVAFAGVELAEIVVFEYEDAMVKFVEREVLFDEALTVVLAGLEEETMVVAVEIVEELFERVLDRLVAVVGPEIIVELVRLIEVVLLLEEPVVIIPAVEVIVEFVGILDVVLLDTLVVIGLEVVEFS